MTTAGRRTRRASFVVAKQQKSSRKASPSLLSTEKHPSLLLLWRRPPLKRKLPVLYACMQILHISSSSLLCLHAHMRDCSWRLRRENTSFLLFSYQEEKARERNSELSQLLRRRGTGGGSVVGGEWLVEGGISPGVPNSLLSWSKCSVLSIIHSLKVYEEKRMHGMHILRRDSFPREEKTLVRRW